jgi:hypothetical protein
LPAAEVLAFEKRIDAAEVLDAAERALARGGGRSSGRWQNASFGAR